MAKKQHNTSIQEQRQEQKLNPSAQQVLAAKLMELSVEELCARIDAECEDNPWLEKTTSTEEDYTTPANDNPDTTDSDTDDNPNDNPDEEPDEEPEQDEQEPAEQQELDDDFPQPQQTADENRRAHQDREILSFHEMLMQQIGEYNLTEEQQHIMEYLIGSLDGDGLMRLPLEQVVDELEIYQGLQTTLEEVEHTLSVLQQFDPWGVGARNLYECLLIQAHHNHSLPMRRQIIELLTNHTDELSMGHWEQIRKRMKLTTTEMQNMRKNLRKLNPRPGGSVGATAASDNHHIVPDFIVTTDEEGTPHFHLNETGIPRVTLADDYDADSALNLNHITSEAMRLEIISAINFQRTRMDEGKMFIDALALRRRSMLLTMAAILRLQESFFRDGDDNLLRPMTREDIAQIIHLDISTVSRVCRGKTVQTPYGTFPLTHFFTTKVEKDGEILSINSILNELKKLIEQEDKHKPLSDEKLTTLLRQKGYNVARRTVTKYRVQAGIPDSRLRR